MATDKQKVLAYLHTAVYERLAFFKQVHGIGSLSKAVEMVLCDYFDINVPGVVLPVTLETLKSCIAPLESSSEEKRKVLSSKYEYLCHEFAKLSNSQSAALQQTICSNTQVPSRHNQVAIAFLGDVLSWIASSAAEEAITQSRQGRAVENNDTFATDAGTPLPSKRSATSGLSASVVKKGLTGVVLASRINSYSSTISKKRSKPNFSEWTRALDPDGIAWEYRAITRRFHPVELRKS